jgi:hypothetical protein
MQLVGIGDGLQCVQLREGICVRFGRRDAVMVWRVLLLRAQDINRCLASKIRPVKIMVKAHQGKIVLLGPAGAFKQKPTVSPARKLMADP